MWRWSGLPVRPQGSSSLRPVLGATTWPSLVIPVCRLLLLMTMRLAARLWGPWMMACLPAWPGLGFYTRRPRWPRALTSTWPHSSVSTVHDHSFFHSPLMFPFLSSHPCLPSAGFFISFLNHCIHISLGLGASFHFQSVTLFLRPSLWRVL